MSRLIVLLLVVVKTKIHLMEGLVTLVVAWKMQDVIRGILQGELQQAFFFVFRIH